jgi:hypothetical protein
VSGQTLLSPLSMPLSLRRPAKGDGFGRVPVVVDRAGDDSGGK